jgi:hypothetical protein
MIRFDNPKLQEHYERFKSVALTFNNDVTEATGLISREIFLIIGGSKWECQVHAVSFEAAKIIVHLAPEDMSLLKAAKEISVQYAFLGLPPISIRDSFLVSYRLSASSSVARIGPNTYLLSLESQGKGIENLVKYLGDFIEANANAKRRKEERIVLNKSTMVAMGLKSAMTYLILKGQRKKSVVMDLSFSGAKILAYEVEAIVGEKAILMISVLDPDEIMEIPCTMVRCHYHEKVQNAVIIGLLFDGDSVPLEYKTRINRTLNYRRESTKAATAKKRPVS